MGMTNFAFHEMMMAPVLSKQRLHVTALTIGMIMNLMIMILLAVVILARRLVAAAAAGIRKVYFFVVKTYTKLTERINGTTLPVYEVIDKY